MILKTYNINAIAVTREYIEDSDVPCGECHQCCIDLSPNLTPEEFESGKYVFTLLNSDPENRLPVLAVPKTETGCFYFDFVNKQCKIYDDRPKACRQFDCRKGHYPPLKNLSISKFGEYNDFEN